MPVNFNIPRTDGPSTIPDLEPSIPVITPVVPPVLPPELPPNIGGDIGQMGDPIPGTEVPVIPDVILPTIPIPTSVDLTGDVQFDKLLIDLWEKGLPEAPNIEEFTVIRNAIDEVLKQYIDTHPDIQSDLLDKYNIDEKYLLDEFLKYMILEAAEGTLPDSLQLILDAYRIYNSSKDAQQWLSEYYTPGDTVAQVLSRFMSEYKRQYAWDLSAGSPDTSSFMHWVDFIFAGNKAFTSTKSITRGLSDIALQFGRMVDIALDDNVPTFDYQKMYDLQLYYTISMMQPAIASIDMSWVEFSEILNMNLLNVDPNDDSLITTLLFTIGSCLGKAQIEKAITPQAILDLLNMMTSKKLQNFAYMREDFARAPLPYYVLLGLVSSVAGVNTIDALGQAVKGLGWDQLVIPIGNTGQVLAIVPGRVGPDLILVDKAAFKNLRNAYDIITKLGPVPKQLDSIVSLLMVGSGFMMIDVDDLTYQHAISQILNPIIDSAISAALPIINNPVSNAISQTLPSLGPPNLGINLPTNLPTALKNYLVDTARNNMFMYLSDPTGLQNLLNSISDKIKLGKQAVEEVKDVIELVEDTVHKPEVDAPVVGAAASLIGSSSSELEEAKELSDNGSKIGESEGLRRKSY